MEQNISPDRARAIILEQVRATGEESVGLRGACGRVLARDVAAPLDLPPFDNSAMDGYAVRRADLHSATPDSPLRLSCAQVLAAAPTETRNTPAPGECARIMTGAPVPPWADAVVAREDVDESLPGSAAFTSGAPLGQHIRRRGEDIARGEIAVHAGRRLSAAEVALLAACGQAQVDVARRPRVAILATGDELAAPGQVLAPGQIYNSNAFALAALAEECGAAVLRFEHVRDDASGFANRLREAAHECDAIITSGGVSAGDFDVVRDVLLAPGNSNSDIRARFWKVAIKPGKPLLFATIRAEESRTKSRDVPIFALPGNPVSVAVTFEEFARPALLAMQGDLNSRRTVLRAGVDRDGRSPADKTEYVRAHVEADGDGGGWLARITGAQGSGRLTTMARANALLVIPAGVARYQAGDEFEARMLAWPAALEQ
jgi:molybdopterin molybdotransferase